MHRLDRRTVALILAFIGFAAAAVGAFNVWSYLQDQTFSPELHEALRNGRGYQRASAGEWRTAMSAHVWPYFRMLYLSLGMAFSALAVASILGWGRTANAINRVLPKPGFFLLLPAATLLLGVGMFVMYTLEFKAGLFPHWADSMAIPIFGTIILTMKLTIGAVILSAALSMLIRSRGPIVVGRTYVSRKRWPIPVAIAVCLPFIAAGLISCTSIYTAPSGLLVLWFGLNLHAGLLNRWMLPQC